MGGDKPGAAKPEEAKIEQPESAGKTTDSSTKSEPSVDRMPSGLALNLAKAAYRLVETKAVEAMLPCILLGPAPTWAKPDQQLAEAKKLFPAGSEPLNLALRKAGKAAPPLTEAEDARLKAHWLFPAGDTKSLDLATRNFTPPGDLNETEKVELAVLTMKAIRERFGGNEPPTTPSPWEQIDEREEFNNAFNVLSDRYKWSEIRQNVPQGGRLPDPITNETIREDADEQLYGTLYRRFNDLKIPELKLSQFIGGHLTGGNIPDDHVVITQTGLIDDNPVTAAERRKNGKGLTRDDAINALFLRMSGFGHTVGENEQWYNEVVSDSRKNPIVTAENRDKIDLDLVRDRKVDPNNPDAPRPEPGFAENHPMIVSGAFLASTYFAAHELYALARKKSTYTGRIVSALARGEGSKDRKAQDQVLEVIDKNLERTYATDPSGRQRYTGAVTATEADWRKLAKHLETQATNLDTAKRDRAAMGVRGLAGMCEGYADAIKASDAYTAAGQPVPQEVVDALPKESPRASLRSGLSAAAAPRSLTFRATSIIGPLLASAGLGGEPAQANAGTVPRGTESGQSRMAEGLDSRTNIVRAEGVSTVPGAAGVLAQAREVGAADLKTMTADRAKLLVSNNPADQKAAEHLREVVEALEGKKGPALEKTARESVSECARRSSEGRLRRGAGLVVGLEMISLAAIEAYQYIYPESAKEQPSTKVKPVPIR